MPDLSNIAVFYKLKSIVQKFCLFQITICNFHTAFKSELCNFKMPVTTILKYCACQISSYKMSGAVLNFKLIY